jgi:exonuclease SbcC
MGRMMCKNTFESSLRTRLQTGALNDPVSAILKKLDITDFRSIRGTLTVPLDAPVVLLHGANGAGKTSVMSAIEFALTGGSEVLRRADPSYTQHVVHRGRDGARIALHAKLDGIPQESQFTYEIAGGEPVASSLPATLAHFFGERCYLAQATLGRLLEIYDAGSRGETLLTRFVKDLLQLDRYDAVVDGLRPTANIRSMRNLIPAYAAAEQRLAGLLSTLERERTLVKELDEVIARATGEIRAELRELGCPEERLADLRDSAREWISDSDESSHATVLTAARQELQALSNRMDRAEQRRESSTKELEVAASLVRQAAESWRRGPGVALALAVELLREDFPDLPSVDSTDPSEAYQEALRRATAEIARLEKLIRSDDEDRDALRTALQALEAARSRLALITEQLQKSAEPGELQSLASALASLGPHIHDDECPVCGRDYSEVSEQPLSSKLAGTIAALVEDANRLQSLTRARLAAVEAMGVAEQRQDVLVARLLNPSDRVSMQSRLARLSEGAGRLAAVEPDIAPGASALRDAAVVEMRLAQAREADRAWADIRLAADELCLRVWDKHLPGDADPGLWLTAMTEHVQDQLAAVNGRQARRRHLAARLDELRSDGLRRASEITSVHRLNEDAERLRMQLDDAAARREAAKDVRNLAAAARTGVVREVFNQTLNEVWRDLFVRLAPSEPFVPAFRVPGEGDRGIAVELETVHRDGGASGAPSAMLSSGNLNTAALTLFLALHLSAPKSLPCLLLDDPVQSMDDVHIAQFAALLRTLSRQLDRQIIIGVHDRELFEYLTLELTPAAPAERLIALELTRYPSGDSVIESTYFGFREDTAFSAA